MKVSANRKLHNSDSVNIVDLSTQVHSEESDGLSLEYEKKRGGGRMYLLC